MRLLSALLFLAAVAYAQSSAPVIASATPNPINAGGAAFTLTVKVAAFVPGAVLKWSGTQLASPTYVDDFTLTTTVPAGLIAICGKYLLTVTNAQNNTVSASYPITVTPVLQSLSPNSLPAGSGGTTVTATGLGFSSNVYLTLIASGTRTNLTTGYTGSTTTLTAFIPANALNGVYPVSLFVTDPTTGAASQTLPITMTYASVSQIYPTAIYAGTASCNLAAPACFTLGVSGANYVYGATVLWNGSPLTTVYQAADFLTATVPAGLVHDKTDVGISVKNPGAAATDTIRLVMYPNPYGSTITSLSPTSAVAGGPGLTVTLTGEGFTSASTVQWMQTSLPTTFVSSTQLTVAIPTNLLATAQITAMMSVSTPGVAVSNAVNFPVVAVTPSVSSISPTSVTAGGPAFTLTVNGDGFILASQVIGLPGITTTYVSLNQLTVSVPASAIATAGTNAIQVVNPGQLISPQAPAFTIKPPATAASISGLSPSSAVPGGAAFTLTVTGSGFTATSKVQWNGTALATTFVNATQLTAAVAPALIAAAGTASITVSGDGGTSNALAFAIAAPLPVVSSGGILNAASSLPAIAPGTLIAIYGSNLAAGTAPAASTPLPVLLGNSSVSINGTPAPLLYVSPGQINAQVPYETKVGTAKLVVQSNGTSGASVDFTVAATGPGVFTPQQSNHVLALNIADGALNAAATPARPGQYVTAYLTGQGVVTPAATTGDVAPSTPPFPVPVATPVVVKIGGVPATIQFAGLAPGFIGLLQLNVLIPDVAAGELSFDVSIGGVAAASTVISIAGK